MVRWDCCAGEHLKYELGTGRPEWQPAFQQLVIDDYPVEVRVFAFDGQIQGVSSYYPPRPLPNTPEIQQFCQDAWALSARFLPHVSAFTVDWMLTATGISSSKAALRTTPLPP